MEREAKDSGGVGAESPRPALEEFVLLTDEREQMRGWSVAWRDAYWRWLSKQPDIYVDFRGQRFTYPFLCFCCGKEVHIRQFCYGRTCGVCDTGICQTNPEYAHKPRITRLDKDSHVVDHKGELIAPLSPKGDPDWLKRIQRP